MHELVKEREEAKPESQRTVNAAAVMRKVRAGKYVTTNEIIEFAKLFEDDYALDTISRDQLQNLARMLGIRAWGTNSYLAGAIESRLDTLKKDDRIIEEEGCVALFFWGGFVVRMSHAPPLHPFLCL